MVFKKKKVAKKVSVPKVEEPKVVVPKVKAVKKEICICGAERGTGMCGNCGAQ
jgi:hypothetical protein